MIAIVDYGMGNLRSVQKACEKAGMAAQLTSDPAQILAAHGVILPGVGAFGRAMENLRSLQLVDPLRQAAQDGRPFLGICLGMQLLVETSEESFGQGVIAGLSLIPGVVRRFPPGFKVPQIGWNQIHAAKPDPLLQDVPKDSYVYFVHSYFVEPRLENDILTKTHYGAAFASSMARGNLYGIQFHPEKSSGVGITILQNFGAMVHDYISRH